MRKLGTENPKKLRIRSGCPTTLERASSTAKIIAVNCLCSGNYLRSSPLVSFTFKQALPSLPAAGAIRSLALFEEKKTHRYPVAIQFRNPAAKPAAQSTFCGIYGLRHLRFASSTAFRRDLVLCQQTSILIRAVYPEQYAFEVWSRLEFNTEKTSTWSPSLIRTHRVEENTTSVLKKYCFGFAAGANETTSKPRIICQCPASHQKNAPAHLHAQNGVVPTHSRKPGKLSRTQGSRVTFVPTHSQKPGKLSRTQVLLVTSRSADRS